MMELNKRFIPKFQLFLLILCLLIGWIAIIFEDFNSFFFEVSDVILSDTLWKLVWTYVKDFIFGVNSHKHCYISQLESFERYVIIAIVLGCVCFVLFKFNWHRKTNNRDKIKDKEISLLKSWWIWPKKGKFAPDKSDSTQIVVNALFDSDLMCHQLRRVASFRSQIPWMGASPVVLADNGFYYDQDLDAVRCFRCHETAPNNINNHNSCHADGCLYRNFNCNTYRESATENQDTLIHQQLLQNHNAQQQHQPEPENMAAGNEQQVLSSSVATLSSVESHQTPTGGASASDIAFSNLGLRCRLQHNRQQEHQLETENLARVNNQQVSSSSAATLSSASGNILSNRTIRRRIRDGRRQRRSGRRRCCIS